MSTKISTFKCLKYKVIKTLLMCKGTSKSSIHQEKMLFSFPRIRGCNDCNQFRSDSALKLSVGRKPSDSDLSSQSTMTRLENCVGSKHSIK